MASELHAGGVAFLGPAAGGGFDDAAGSTFEFDKSDAMVFHFDVFVGEEGGVGLYGFDGAGGVKEGVDGVDRLVHEGAATVEGPSAAPSGGVVVGLVAIPLDVGGGGGEFAETVSVYGGFEGVHAGVEAAVEDGGEGFAVGGSGGDELVATLEGDFERFFDDGVFAGIEGGEGGVEVGSAGGADGDDFEFGVGEEIVEVGEAFGSVFGGEFVGSFLVEIED